MSAPLPSTASTPDGFSELPGYTANLLGPARASLAKELRRRLLAAGMAWPEWIDARPGLLQVILGDCSDPPLGQSNAAYATWHGELLLDGIAALALITAAPRMALCGSEPTTLAALRTLCAERPVEVIATAPAYPACPELDVKDAPGHAYTVSAAQLVRIGALVRGVVAPRLCTVAGAIIHPQVLALSSDDGASTPEALVRRCGGARAAAWVALSGGALSGVLWPHQSALPATTALCLILPVAHELVTRLRRGEPWQLRARNACLSCRACTDFCPEAQSGAPLVPHLIMRSLASVDSQRPPRAEDAAACTGCGACSVACPAELLPGAFVQTLAQLGPRLPVPAPLPLLPTADRRLPKALMLARLGLAAYTAPPLAPLAQAPSS